MIRTLALIQTSHLLIPVFSRLVREMLPGLEVFHVVDESLIKNTIRSGRLTKSTIRRVVRMIELAGEGGGADAVMVTCSSIGPAVDVARQHTAAQARRTVELVPRLCEGAFNAVMSGGNELGESETPILSSPELAVQMLRDTFQPDMVTAQA